LFINLPVVDVPLIAFIIDSGGGVFASGILSSSFFLID